MNNIYVFPLSDFGNEDYGHWFFIAKHSFWFPYNLADSKIRFNEISSSNILLDALNSKQQSLSDFNFDWQIPYAS